MKTKSCLTYRLWIVNALSETGSGCVSESSSIVSTIKGNIFSEWYKNTTFIVANNG